MNIPFRHYWQLLSRHIRPQMGRFVLLGILLFSGIALRVINPQIIRYFIDTVTTQGPASHLINAAILFIVVALFQQVLGVGAAYMGEYVAWTATNDLRAELAWHCLNLDMSFHNNISSGELIERIDGDVAELSNFFSQFVIRVIGNMILVIGILIAIYIEDWRLGLVFTFFVIVTLLALNRVRGIAIPSQKAVREASADLFGYLEERLAGTEDIRSAGAVDFVLLGLYKLMYRMIGFWKKASLLMIVVIGVTTILLAVGLSAAFVGGYIMYQNGIFTIGAVYLLVNYLNTLRRPIRELTQQVENLQNIGAATERLIELRAVQSKLQDGFGAVLPDSALSLAFQDVGFSYVDGDHVLDAVSFELQPGKALGLLGRTGSGKTTLARLVFRLYDISEGKILLGAVNTRDARLDDLRKRVAIVTQDVQLFQATVRDNLTFFDDSVSDDFILKVIDELGLSDWLHSLPKGLDTKLETGGRSLSAGEAQLLAFTRVFLRDPGLVILDEASSRLDPATEQLIERAVDRLLKDRTAIIIAHRLRTVERTDEILILDGGRVVEHGDRQTLEADQQSKYFQLLQTGLEEVLV
ncbi:MAG TPA: ABC transporter ATP-binding protein [Anaerolineales bacterium]|nr:ABC transporter ATP-binding protein [Anaerolineales bacterium]